jgi:hypothetical protein
VMQFYGPAQEVAEAVEIFTEWSRLIASMSLMKYGGVFRGDGAKYAYGFATALARSAQSAASERRRLPGRQLEHQGKTCTDLTIAGRHEIIKKEAENWLEKDKGVKLRKGGARTGYSAGGTSAYEAGRRDGSNAGFGRSGRKSGRLLE